MQHLGQFLRQHPILCSLLGLFVICVIFFHQPLFSGEIVNATDIVTQQYFWSIFTKESLLHDPCFTTWLPYINAGSPSGGGLDLLLRPVSLLTLLLFPVHIAINYEIVIYFLLLGVGMYFYMRELQVSPLSSFLAALFLMLNGEIVTLINAGHVNKIGAIFPVTFVFWAFERALKRQTFNAFLLTGATLGFQFWQGHVQISFYLCIAIGVYYVVRVSVLYAQERQLAQIGKLTTYALVMVLVFLALSAVEFLPLLTFSKVSERSEGVSYEFATTWSMPPEELITYVIPGFFGLRRINHDEDEKTIEQVEYWGRMPFTQTGRYFGILPLLLMLLGVCFVRNRHILTLSVLALIVMLLGMGQYIPIYKLLYNYAPGFNRFRVPQMILYLFAFAASGLAGFGSEWLFTQWSDLKEKRLRGFLVALTLLCLLAWGLILLLPQMQSEILSVFKETFFRKGGTPELAAVRFQNIFRGGVWFNIMFSVALFMLSLPLMKKLVVRWMVVGIVAIVLLDVWVFNEKYIDTVALDGSMYLNENDTIRYCQKDPGLYRILPLVNEPESYAVSNKYVYYKLFSVTGYEAVGVQYYNDYLNNMIFGSRLVDLLNIKYIALPKNTSLNNEVPEIGKVIGPYKIVLNSDALLLENLNVLPRAFPVHQARVFKQTDAILPAMLQPSFDPRQTVILEEEPPAFAPSQVSSSASTIQITEYFNRTIHIRAAMAADGFLVLSEKYYPGWKAYVNGKPTPIYKADYTFQAIFLPQGDAVVTFVYQPQQFLLGMSITLLAGGVLLGAVAWQRVFPNSKFPWMIGSGKKIPAFLKNLFLVLVSFAVMLASIEFYMRRAPQFQHGGDREPRNDPQLTWEKPPGVKRIVVIGDSLTFGDGVKAVETYPFKLQAKLRAHYNQAIQVINLGIMGINTDQEAMLLTGNNPYFGRPAFTFDPDLILLTFTINDIELMPDPKPRPETILLPKALHHYLRNHYRLYIFLHDRLNQLFTDWGLQESYTAYLQRIYTSETQEWQLFRDYLTYIMQETQKQQKRLVLVIFPELSQFDDAHPFLPLYAKVSNIGKMNGVPVLDLFPYFRGKDAASLRVSLMNGHPNEQAYEIAAEAMYQMIVEQKLL